MKYRLGACAALLVLAACSQEDVGTGLGALSKTANRVPDKALAAPLAKRDQKSIASAPDRGALMTYANQGKPAKREGAYTWYPVAISEDHAFNAVVTGKMSIPSPDGGQVELNYERHVEGTDGNWTWIGRVEGGDPGQEAIITFGEKAVFASIPQPTGPALEIRTSHGALWAVTADPRKLRSPNVGKNDILIPPTAANHSSVAAPVLAESQKVVAAAVAAAAPPGAANTVDLVIGYSIGFRNGNGGSQSSATTRLVQLVAVANETFANSQINGYLRLVNALEVNYADNTDNEIALNELTGNNGSGPVTVPAALAPIRTARDEYGADVAVLMRDFTTPENDGCGVAWLNGANGTTINPTTDDDYGFAVVGFGNDTGTDNNSYFCPPETLIHEVAHLMGSAHDKANANQQGAYPYSYGYKTDSANGNFYTVMAYGSDNQATYRVFSNPGITFCGGRVCGIANQADNARSLNQTIPVVAQFRSTLVPFGTVKTAGIGAGEINADGRDDLFFLDSASRTVNYWLMNGFTISTKSASREYGSDERLVATGDFNGDSKLDMVWVTSSSDLWIWLGNGSNLAASYKKVATLGAGWNVVAAGDVDGDGKDDLVFVNPNPNRYTYWIMNGTTIVRQASPVALGAGEKLVANGDFNGDKKLDLLWQKSSDLWMWLGNGNTLSSTYKKIATLGAGWVVKAAGDIDANGKDDLVFVNPSPNRYTYWKMDGTTIVSQASPALLASGDTFVASGDFNADNKLDLLWQTTAKDLWMWLGDGTKLSASYKKIANADEPLN